MAWWNPSSKSRYLSWVVGIAVLAVILFWLLKIRDIQRLRVEIAQIESQINQGQDLWRSYPPLSPEQIRKVEEAQQRLFHSLPKDKDIPSLLQELSRLAQQYNMTDVTFISGDGASPTGSQAVQPGAPLPQSVAPPPSASVSPGASAASGPIASLLVKVGFAGDYREIAYFLEALQRLPRLVTVQSVQLQRSPPLVAGEVLVSAYYQRENLPEARK
jgi:Tfp pilus assembly protein PilO